VIPPGSDIISQSDTFSSSSPVATVCTSAEKQIVAGCEIVNHFQPLCSIKSRSIVGVEALVRGKTSDGTLIPPSRLFPRASRENVAAELEQHCRRQAMATFSRQLPYADQLILFLNLDLSLSAGPDDASQLAAAARHWGLTPNRIVVEVLESRFEDTDALTTMMIRFRQRGFLLALDDMGAGHSNLNRVPLIQPDVIKIDRHLIHNIDVDYYRQGVFKAMVHLGRRIGALIVAEGVETRSEALTALELGADLLQGYHLSRPHSPERLRLWEVDIAVQKLADHFKRHMVERISEQNLQHKQYDAMLAAMVPYLEQASGTEFDAMLQASTPSFPTIECMFILNENGIQVSTTVCRPGLQVRRNRGLFRPAPRGADQSLKDYYYLLRNDELKKFTTDPYVSMATGNLCQTSSVSFRNQHDQRVYILCVDVAC